jgi:hypothetical protein
MNKCLRWVVQLQFTRPEKKEIKHEKFLLLISTVVAVSFVSVSIQQSSAQANNDESIVKQGLAIAPVDLDLSGKNRALVGIGSYLVELYAAVAH